MTEPARPAPAATPPPTTVPAEKTDPTQIPGVPTSPPVVVLPPPPAPKPPAPTPAPPPAGRAETPAAAPAPEVAVRELLAQYKSALEARNLDALKRVWPSLTPGSHPRPVPTGAPDHRRYHRSADLFVRCHRNGDFHPPLRGGDGRGTTAPARRVADDDGHSSQWG